MGFTTLMTSHMIGLYERVALPIEKGGMALNNTAFISLTAFACSLAASMKELAKVFPDWIEIVNDGALVSVLYDKSPDVAAQIVKFVSQYRALALFEILSTTNLLTYEMRVFLLRIRRCRACHGWPDQKKKWNSKKMWSEVKRSEVIEVK